MHAPLHRLAATLAQVALIALSAGGCTPASAPGRDLPAPRSRAAEPIETDLALVTFDSAWRRVRDTHYDPAMRGVNWDAVRDSLRPRAATARTLGDLRATISTMLSTLGESHFGLIPQEVADGVSATGSAQPTVGEAGDVGLEVRLVGGSVLVTRVHPGSPAQQAGVRTGWVVDSVGPFGPGMLGRLLSGGLPRRQQLAAAPARVTAALVGQSGTPVDVVFRDAEGRAVRRRLVRAPVQGEVIRFGNLPAMLVRVEREARPSGAGCIGVIRFSAWMTPIKAQLDSAVDELRGCRGIVVDLRGNPGGVGGMVMGFGGHFVDSVVTLGILRSRGTTLRFITNPQRANVHHQPVRPYAGPLAVLVDSLSMSTSEIFAAGMQAIGRARLFGEATPGLALPAVLTRLPSGDVLMHVVADYTDGSGRRVEGGGAVPDEVTPLTRDGLLSGTDGALEAAIRWISGSGRPGEP